MKYWRIFTWAVLAVLVSGLVACGATEEPSETAVSNPPTITEDGQIEVTYTTPSQQEGPYYTVEKPADRDNDLTVLDGAAGEPAGEIVEFGGALYDRNGRPIPNATIEIWQTDASGAYLHPNDPSTDQRDRNFQFYGEAVTDENGRYSFRTILPGEYEPRPRHIHFKVKLDGETLITSQFYFAADNSGQPDPLIITLNPGEDTAGNTIQTGQRDIILNLEL
ncbi:hypothetical protein [Candidatus Leptofilum sp.]|uniref:dioxygenase family protein n=1 Tax=Candidatus Leptofilum sp. TaxID=3241576 RepID=UPI003B5AB939